MISHSALESARQNRHRIVIHLEGERDRSRQLGQALLAHWSIHDALWVDESLKDPLKMLRSQLGTERQAVVLDAFDGLNPSVPGIVQGLVRACGVFILISPKASAWPDYDDPDYARLQTTDQPQVFANKRFIRHILACLDRHHASVITLPDDAIARIADVPALPVPVAVAPELFRHQTLLVERIKQVLKSRPWRPLVIEAHRGRGKSTALGLAIGQLLTAEKRPVSLGVCAISRQAATTLFFHAAAPGVVKTGNGLLQFGDSHLQFYAPDQLLDETPPLDLLIVEEAGALPVAILESLTNHYARVVLATTTGGYEGSGQGFSLRFAEKLTERFPHSAFERLSEPLRYGSNDPLECLVDDCLLLDVLLPDVRSWPLRDDAGDGKAVCRRVSQEELLDNPDLLEKVQALLVNAHYQTTPDDLRLLLDHPDLSLWISEVAGWPVAVCLLMQEGGFTEQQKQQLLGGRRRFRGHRMPQMFLSVGLDHALTFRYGRIQRIAVVKGLQNRSLGSQLLVFVRANCGALDFLGASFSLSPEVLGFWRKNGFSPVFLGSHRASATGQFSSCVVFPLNDMAAQQNRHWQQIFRLRLPYQLLTVNQSIHPVLIPGLLEGAVFDCQAEDLEAVRRYMAGQAAFESIQPGLYRCYMAWLPTSGVEPSEIQLALMEKLILNRTFGEIARRYCFSGRKSLETAFRDCFQVIFQVIFQKQGSANE